MKDIELLLLNFGFSWTSSKLIPFVILLFFGCGFALMLKNKKLKIKWLNPIKTSLIVILPTAIYFVIFPIYEGDLYKSGIKISSELTFKKEKILSIIVLPDCSFCFETIEITKKLLKRNSNCSIEYIIASRPNEIPHGIADKIPKKCSIRLEYDVQKLAQLTHGAYPSYCISEKGEIVKLWRTEHFGTRALDEIEEFCLSK